ncbi:MAG: beta-galactosidase trimerization domain-containing protein [Bryobacteraceae bacterium]|nr:beta-galactosidase trimerization domain-containing protein [Bryobacteraceae bacterium]
MANIRFILLVLCAASCCIAQPDRIPKAKWLRDGIINAGGSHEPHLFIVRRGGYRLDARAHYERAQSEETIRRLKEQGVEVFHTHLYKGFGMAAEKPEMEDAVRAAAIAHRYGLKVDSYIQWNTMMYETFFAEEPKAKNWIQRDAQGQPIMLTYGYQQSYRFRPCFSNQEYLDYLKRIVRFAMEQVKTDFIHFDNFDLNPEPESCHCDWCVRGFRNHLRKKYPPERRKERFGFENVDHVSPPRWNMHHPPSRMDIIFDPAIQEWIDYRCQSMTDALAQMALYARSFNPDVAIEINPHGINGGNRAWERGIDHARLLKFTDAFWTEVEGDPRMNDDGSMPSRIRSYKMARTYDNILLTYTGHPLSIGESLAFNQTIGFAGSDPLDPETRRHIDFYRKHRDLYAGARDDATVALLRSYPSIAYHHSNAQLSAILAEQALIEAKIPFVLIFDEHLADLAKHKTLVLPDSECLSDKQLEAIRAFVARGGGLVATGLTGLYDEWRRLRPKPGLAGLIDEQPSVRAYEERVARVDAAGREARKEYENGRVAYFSQVEPDPPRPRLGPYFEVTQDLWRRPVNWQEIADAVRWAARDALPVRVSGPPHLVMNLTAQPERKRVMTHLLNYRARANEPVNDVEVMLRLPEASSVRATLISPGREGEQSLTAVKENDEWRIAVPPVEAYAIVVANY